MFVFVFAERLFHLISYFWEQLKNNRHRMFFPLQRVQHLVAISRHSEKIIGAHSPTTPTVQALSLYQLFMSFSSLKFHFLFSHYFDACFIPSQYFEVEVVQGIHLSKVIYSCLTPFLDILTILMPDEDSDREIPCIPLKPNISPLILVLILPPTAPVVTTSITLSLVLVAKVVVVVDDDEEDDDGEEEDEQEDARDGVVSSL